VELLSGGDMLVRSLREEGVELVFGYPGGAALHIYDALFRQDKADKKYVRHILARHEQGAAHAADGYARATGKVGTVLVTSGPGATNAITGIATAYMDSIPMVVISGQVASHLIGEDAFQETDMVGISRPIVKHSFLVKSARDIPSVIKKAYYIASTGRPGPVVVDIPKDITDPARTFEFEYPKKIKLRSYTPASRGHSGQIRKAVQILLSAKRPILYCGGGVVQGNASESLTRLAKKLGYPVTNTLMGLGCFPATDKQFVGMLGMHGTFEANTAMHHSDVILALGARFDDRVTNTPSKFCPNATIIHVDIDPASISKTVVAHVPIVGAVDLVLQEMLSLLDESNEKPDAEALDAWWKQIDAWQQKHGIYTANRFETTGEIKPQEVVQAIYEVTKGQAYITSDVGQHQMFAAQYYKFDKPRRWINSGGLGTMGFGLPAAMGAQFADPKATVACITGEGSIQMCIQELSTCTQYRLPIKIICINNQALGMVKQWQDMQYEGRYSESLYEESLPDFIKLAESYGHVGMRVTKREELKSKMEECFALKDKVVFLDVMVDPAEHVYPMLIAPNGSMRDMWLSKTERT
jgi:acetolactate synthase-1/2/3 large subunit